MDGAHFAAKCFYHLGSSHQPPSLEENYRHLKQELAQQKIAESCLEKFSKEIMQKKIASAGRSDIFIDFVTTSDAHFSGIHVTDAFLLTIVDGAKSGHTWIVDPLLNETNTQKFLGPWKLGKTPLSLGRPVMPWPIFRLRIPLGKWSWLTFKISNLGISSHTY
jgi:hypothetical protein